MATHLFVSPHLDDIALSCGGRMLSDLDAGHRVVVATVYSSGKRLVYDRRREEDRDALSSIGAEVVHLGLEDAPYRLGRPLRFSSLMLGPAPTASDVATAREVVATTLSRVAPDTVWFPLGVGGHVDHLAVFACQSLVAAPRFYFDRPYSFSSALTALRLAALGCEPPPVGDAELEEDLRGMEAFFAPGERPACIDEIARRLGEPFAPSGGLVLHRASFTRDVFARAATLLGGYHSQGRLLFAGESPLTAYTRWCGTEGGGFSERWASWATES